MDIQASGNDKFALTQCVSDFVTYVRTEIYFFRKSFDDAELSYVLWLQSDLYGKLRKYGAVLSGTKWRGMISQCLKMVDSVNRDVSSIKLAKPFDMLLHNRLMSHSAFCRKIYKLYNRCIDALHELETSDDVLSDTHKPVWSKKDILIGSLRNREQLNLCLKHNFYHVPFHCIPSECLPLSYIAIYQSKNMFGAGSGIKYYGKISSADVVDRGEIHEIPGKSSGKYYKFYVDRWLSLPETIKVTTGGAYFSYTNLYMLTRAQETHELYFNTEQECKMYYAVMNAINKKLNKVSCQYNKSTVAIDDGYIFVVKNSKVVYRVSINDFQNRKASCFKMICELSS